MTYFVRIIARSGRERLDGALYGFDMTEQQLLERVVVPYRHGAPVTLRGRTLRGDDIAEITITRAGDRVGGHPLVQLREAWKKNRVSAGNWFAEKATDVTDEYIHGAPGYLAAKLEQSPQAEEQPVHVSRGAGPRVPPWLAASLGAAALLGTLVSLGGAPAWFIGGAIGIIVMTGVLHRHVWRWPPVRWASFLVLGLAAVLGIGAWYCFESDSTSDDGGSAATSGRPVGHGPSASIARPAEGARVPYQVRVTGTSTGVPGDTRPWLFVQSQNGDLYPQGGDHGNNVEIGRSTGIWCGYAYFGRASRSSAGGKYSVIVALPPSHAADERLQHKMENPPPGGVPHWPSLRGGFEQLAAREVTRLPYVQSEAQLEATASCR